MNHSILKLKPTISSTWENAKSAKIQIWIPFIIILVLNTIAKYTIQFGYNVITHSTMNLNSQIPLHLLIATEILSAVLIAPIYTGIILNCIEGNNDVKKITAVHVMCFNHCLRLSCTAAIIALLASSANLISYLYFSQTGTHIFLLTLFSTLLYPALWYSLTILALPLVCKNNASSMTSLKISFNIMRRHNNWLKIALIYLMILFIFILALSPLAYGLLHKNSYIMITSASLVAVIAYRAIPFIFMFNATVFNTLIKLQRRP
jgi:hypothetical protein